MLKVRVVRAPVWTFELLFEDYYISLTLLFIGKDVWYLPSFDAN